LPPKSFTLSPSANLLTPATITLSPVFNPFTTLILSVSLNSPSSIAVLTAFPSLNKYTFEPLSSKTAFIGIKISSFPLFLTAIITVPVCPDKNLSSSLRFEKVNITG